MNIDWTCPDCGTVNSNDINHAQYCTCICEECKAECEVDFEVEIINISKV